MDVAWKISKGALAVDGEVRRVMGERYEAQREALRSMLCAYFEAGCVQDFGKAICSVGRTSQGLKVVKARWALPGRGKRGGLRLALIVDCKQSSVLVAEAVHRKENPDFSHICD